METENTEVTTEIIEAQQKKNKNNIPKLLLEITQEIYYITM